MKEDGEIVRRHLKRWLVRYRDIYPISSEADKIADAYAAGWRDSRHQATEPELVSAEEELMSEYLASKRR